MEPAYLVGGDRTAETFELDLTDRLGVDNVFDLGEHTLADQDLPRRRISAEPGREVSDRPERTVVVAAFEANPAQRGIAGRDADAEPRSKPRFRQVSASSSNRSWTASAIRIAWSSWSSAVTRSLTRRSGM